MSQQPPPDALVQATMDALPYGKLADCIEQILKDPTVRVPARIVHSLGEGASLFVMPASDSQIAITKLITFVADNAQRGLPAIQGDVVVFDARTGRRLAVLDGPTVTARRTAGVSLAAARLLSARTDGPMLIIGAGMQGRSHLEAFAAGLGVREVRVASRSSASVQALVEHARALGLEAKPSLNLQADMDDCPIVVTCTSAQQVAVHAMPRQDAFIAAVGAFTPQMVEWSADVVRALARRGSMVVDSRDADHEAGDLLQAGVDVPAIPTLADVMQQGPSARGRRPVFFKSCGWAGWDLAAARCALEAREAQPLVHK